VSGLRSGRTFSKLAGRYGDVCVWAQGRASAEASVEPHYMFTRDRRFGRWIALDESAIACALGRWIPVVEAPSDDLLERGRVPALDADQGRYRPWPSQPARSAVPRRLRTRLGEAWTERLLDTTASDWMTTAAELSSRPSGRSPAEYAVPCGLGPPGRSMHSTVERCRPDPSPSPFVSTVAGQRGPERREKISLQHDH